MKQVLIIFAKNPVYGKVKSRLASTIGKDAALKVYQQLLHHTVAITRDIGFDKVVWYADYVEKDDCWKNDLYKKQVQEGVDLGERMQHAFRSSFHNGYTDVIIIGTDCFELDPKILQEAFEALSSYDIVAGPARDGGYYLLGMKKLYPFLFENIAWSTEKVLAQTLASCKRNQLSVYLLPELSDIDDQNDLDRISEQLFPVN